jgi:cobalt-zinc-cadmium efflux system membrane fusion protein
MTDVRGTLQVSGRVETDASRIARVGSPVAGRILKLNAFEGENVRAGTVLATLHSTSLSDTQMSLIKAYSDQTLAEAATKRAEQLVAADVIGRAELERRRAEVVQASAEVSSYETQLHGLGMTDSQMKALRSTRRLSADYPIVTPRSGTVLERKITVGQVVQPADPAYTIADLSNVWVVANVPEQEAGLLHKGLEVSVRIPARPEQEVHGVLSYVAPTVDPATRTVEVRMDLPNTQGLFKPDELASVTFGGHTERKLTVPQTAIVREENKDYVFVQTSANQFLLREVELGDESDDQRVVQSGVAASERIVLDGAFHLNNQRKQNAIKGSH